MNLIEWINRNWPMYNMSCANTDYSIKCLYLVISFLGINYIKVWLLLNNNIRLSSYWVPEYYYRYQCLWWLSFYKQSTFLLQNKNFWGKAEQWFQFCYCRIAIKTSLPLLKTSLFPIRHRLNPVCIYLISKSIFICSFGLCFRYITVISIILDKFYFVLSYITKHSRYVIQGTATIHYIPA